MSQTFEVALSFQPGAKHWGSDSLLSYNEAGATIHLSSKEDCLTERLKIQQVARKLSQSNIPAFKLSGNWDLEAQWHFWQGVCSPKQMPTVEFSKLTETDSDELHARIQSYSWAKKMINLSPEDLSPVQLATQAGEFLTQIAPESISYNIISGEALDKAGLVGIYNVGRGSKREPALLELDFCPPGTEDQVPAAALVGKGITFDSGGYSLKSSVGMLHMKSDMGGAATVTGALALAISNGLKKRIKLYLCCAENLVSGHAYKLADILKYKNGVTVEVVNTDAEGRLVLADGLILADESDAPVVIDAATLTGAACVAVGDHYNAMFSMDDSLAQQFERISKQEHDPFWRLPLEPFHQDNCPSDYATTANSKPTPGGGVGGASNAAGFLSRFIDYNKKRWIHLDLAACYRDSGNSLFSAGATGRGVRSISRYLCDL
ncbi:MAG: aminopeptidase PepB [Kangiellaceae bacterium]|nr:aminopeptidase PepB [Kangiellaceae bacterium]